MTLDEIVQLSLQFGFTLGFAGSILALVIGYVVGTIMHGFDNIT
jgi:hypothetical protein